MKSIFPTVEILGSEVNILELEDAVKAMLDWIEKPDGNCHQIIVTGFHGLWEGFKNPEFGTILNLADLWIPDGIAPVWIARIKGLTKARRIPGANLMERFLQLADRKEFSSFFYGDTDDTLEKLKQRLQTSYPGHRIVGTFSPPFRALTPEEDDKIVQIINDKRPDVVWVGLGMPKQERWIFEHKEKLNAPIAIGVGAAFRFLAGKVKRVPEWAGDTGLEWAWRLVMEPKKLWRRDFIEGPQFLMHVTLEIAGIRKYRYQYQRNKKSSK